MTETARGGRLLSWRILGVMVMVATALHAPVEVEAAQNVTVRVDATGTAGTINSRVGGMVMIVRDPGLPVRTVQALGLKAGRFDTWHFRSPAATMPQCWTGTESDFEPLDPYVEWGLDAGVDPLRSHFRIAYLSSCHLTGPLDESVVGQALGSERFHSGYPPVWAATIYTNPEAVENMLYDLMRHVSETYEIGTFAIWTEPDGLHPMPPHTYFEYYRLAHRALHRVEEDTGQDLRIGGPVTAFQDFPFMFLFLDFIIRNELDLDELVFHRYAGATQQGEPTSDVYRTAIRQVRNQVQTMAANRGADWLDPEIRINEWGFDPTGRDPSNVDGAAGAFVVSTLTTFLDERLDAADFFFLQDNPEASCDNGCQPLTDFVNYGVLDSEGEPRSSYHAFRMFSDLGEERIRAEPSFAVVQGRQEWGALASRREDGSVTLLLRNWDPDRSGEDLRVELVVDGFEVDEWRAEEVGIATGGTVGELSGTGPPVVELPTNHVVLLTLESG